MHDFQHYTLWFIDNIPNIITVATIITALTPSRSDNIFLDKCLKILNIMAGNILQNKNKDD